MCVAATSLERAWFLFPGHGIGNELHLVAGGVESDRELGVLGECLLVPAVEFLKNVFVNQEIGAWQGADFE